MLEGGALAIDNPGMREFGILGAESGMGRNFSDILGLAVNCRYRDCSHAGEPGCAVEAAVNSGLSQDHYDNFIKLRAEAEFHQMSYVEKRKKDKDFGKFIKSVKKDLEGLRH
jgi:ribosome biogenesis GTPase